MLFKLARAICVLTGSAISSTRIFDHKTVSRRIGASLEQLEERTLMSTYYVSTSGNDTHAGNSISAAWKSISKVNATSLKPGDSVLFQGGQTFSGTITLNSGEGGSATAFVTFGSYNGRATISSGTSDGAKVYNTSGVQFENLKFLGKPGSLTQYGIDFETNTTNYKRPNISVDNCEVTGYGNSGIVVAGDKGNAGFTNVSFTNNTIHDNVNAGINTWAQTQKAIDNVTISGNTVFSNYGDGTSYVTGSGIELGDVEIAMVQHNIAYLNGWKGGNGGVGIWAYESDGVTFQYNESYSNHGLRGHDGDGFDFDADTSNSVMQYNYAAGNDGTGFQLDQWRSNALFYNDVVRYNTAENNGQRNGYGSLEVWGAVWNSQIYANTVYVSAPVLGGSTPAVRVYNNTINGLYAKGVHISSNTFITTGGMPMINVPSAEKIGSNDLIFVNNTYDAPGSTPSFIYNGVTYKSLASWANSTGQEKTNGAITGIQSSTPVAFPAFSAPKPVATTAALIAPVTASTLVQTASVTAAFGSTTLADYLENSITG